MKSLTRTLLFLVAAAVTATATASPIDSVALKPLDAVGQIDQTAGLSVPFVPPIYLPRPFDFPLFPLLADMDEPCGEALAHQASDRVELSGPPEDELVCWWLNASILIWRGGW